MDGGRSSTKLVSASSAGGMFLQFREHGEQNMYLEYGDGRNNNLPLPVQRGSDRGPTLLVLHVTARFIYSDRFLLKSS